MSEKGRLIVVSGHSGAGKSTVVFKAIEGRKDMCFSTSVTSRKARPGEVDGREYFFITRERFAEMIENDELLEHAEYVGNCYGTPRKFVEDKLAQGMNVVLDIEVQGARQESMAGRLTRAREEYAEADFYDYIVVNDTVDEAARELNAILLAEKCRFQNRVQYLREI